MTVGAGLLHTSTRRKIRVRWSRCQSDFLQGTRNKDRVARVYANPILSPPKLRYPPVACPSHLTMLSKREAFSFHLIVFRPLLAPQTRITISKVSLGAPPTRIRRRRHQISRRIVRRGVPFCPFTALRIPSIDLRYPLKNGLLPYFTSIYFHQTHIAQCMLLSVCNWM